MGWFTYECPVHGTFKKSLEKRVKHVSCSADGDCTVKCHPIIKASSSVQVVERLDNGAMARAVERLHNIEEIMEERSDSHSKGVMEKLGEVDEDEDD